MGKSQRLREHELRAVYRLLSDIREMRHDRPALHRHIVDTLCTLVGATGGFAADIAGWRPGDTPRLQTFTPTAAGFETVARTMETLAVNNNLWDDPTFGLGLGHTGTVESMPFHAMLGPDGLRDYPVMAQAKLESRHVDHLVAWHQKRPRRPDDGGPTGDIFGASLHRYGKGERLFAGREIALARLLFEELQWLHATGRLAPPGPDRDALPPRLREVLDLLLEGLAPKQIAQRLGLSLHTVREHVRRLYDRFDADGRDALVARFVRGGRAVLVVLAPAALGAAALGAWAAAGG